MSMCMQLCLSNLTKQHQAGMLSRLMFHGSTIATLQYQYQVNVKQIDTCHLYVITYILTLECTGLVGHNCRFGC